MAVNATDNEAYATELWGDAKRWDDEQKQFVPTGDEPKAPEGPQEPEKPQPIDTPATGKDTRAAGSTHRTRG